MGRSRSPRSNLLGAGTHLARLSLFDRIVAGCKQFGVRLGLARELDIANDGLFFRGNSQPAIPIDGCRGWPEHPLAQRHDPGCTPDIKLVSLTLPLQGLRLLGSFGRDRFPPDQYVGLNRAARGLDLNRISRGETGKLEQTRARDRTVSEDEPPR